MPTIRVSEEVHRRFKAACALRGVQMQEAAGQALDALMVFWGDGTAFTPEEMAKRLEGVGKPVVLQGDGDISIIPEIATFIREENCQ